MDAKSKIFTQFSGNNSDECHCKSICNIKKKTLNIVWLQTKDNETALHCAAQYGHTEVVAQLLQYGCDPSIRNSRGESALDLAAQYGR